MADQTPELAAGSLAPEFRLPASTGGEIGLADYRAKANLILFFIREYN
jgi:peroxiredoxin